MDEIDAVILILKEYRRAKQKHPKYPKDPVHQVAIIAEEAGEATRASLQWCYEGATLSKIDKEVIETGAMALRYLTENHICVTDGDGPIDREELANKFKEKYSL